MFKKLFDERCGNIHIFVNNQGFLIMREEDAGFGSTMKYIPFDGEDYRELIKIANKCYENLKGA